MQLKKSNFEADFYRTLACFHAVRRPQTARADFGGVHACSRAGGDRGAGLPLLRAPPGHGQAATSQRPHTHTLACQTQPLWGFTDIHFACPPRSMGQPLLQRGISLPKAQRCSSPQPQRASEPGTPAPPQGAARRPECRSLACLGLGVPGFSLPGTTHQSHYAEL